MRARARDRDGRERDDDALAGIGGSSASTTATRSTTPQHPRRRCPGLEQRRERVEHGGASGAGPDGRGWSRWHGPGRDRGGGARPVRSSNARARAGRAGPARPLRSGGVPLEGRPHRAVGLGGDRVVEVGHEHGLRLAGRVPVELGEHLAPGREVRVVQVGAGLGRARGTPRPPRAGGATSGRVAVDPSWPSTVASTTAGSPCRPPGALTWANTHSGDDDAGLRPTAYATGWRQPSIRAARWSRMAARPSGVLQSRSVIARIVPARGRRGRSPGAGEQRVNSGHSRW